MGLENITRAGGFGLALTGMTIVFIALVLVSLFIAGLPRLLPLVNSLLPELEGHHGVTPAASTSAASAAVEEELIAAIGYALHVHRDH
ncbi:MAG: OadG family protein [Planctomycetaceae bacterium]|nr:OadG family protein [Planctomycetaceae bacterium]